MLSADDLEVAFESLPHTYLKAGFLGNLWNTIATCETYGSLLKKTYALLFERHQESSQLFDFLILLILVFFAFLIPSIYTIFFEERKSLKEVHNKVSKIDDALVSRAFWALKEIKVNNLRMEVECKQANKVEIPTYMFDRNPLNKFDDVTIIAFADLSLPITSDWIPKSKNASEINNLILPEQLSFNNPQREISGIILRLSNMTAMSDVFRDKRIMRQILDTVSSVELYSKGDFSSTSVEAIPEAHSDVEDTSTKIWMKEIIRPSKDYKSKKEELEEHNLPNNNVKPAKNNGIFSKRQKIQEKVTPTKSIQQIKNDGRGSSTLRFIKTSTNSSKTLKTAPKKSGIFNKSKIQLQFEVLSGSTSFC